MRFEAKHNYFKDLAHWIKCFKNVLKTLSEHHQTMCYNLGSGDIFESKLSVGPCKVYMYVKLKIMTIIAGQMKIKPMIEWGPVLNFIPEMDVKRYITELLLFALSIVSSVSWAKITGYQYKRGQVIVISTTDSMPNFGTIVDIIVHEVEIVYIVLKKLCTLSFHHHFHSYCVTYIEPALYIAIQVSELYDNHPLSLYHSPNNDSHDLFVPMKYHLSD